MIVTTYDVKTKETKTTEVIDIETPIIEKTQQPSTEERIEALETALLSLMME